jgi:hypothetical protein
MDDLQLKNTSTKPFVKQEIYADTLSHLIWMAGLKGAKHYAWDRAKKLDADPSGLWTGIAADLTKAMNETSGKN